MMKNYGFFGLLGLIGLSIVFTLPAHAEDSSRVFISEINWAGSETSTADEWIELVNLGPTPADISHYVLTGTATSNGAIEIAEGTVIQPGQTLLIANYSLDDPKTTLLATPNLVTSALSIPNSALEIMLVTPSGLVIDSYVDAGTLDFGTAKPAVSIERDLSSLNWRASTNAISLSLADQLGTPGVVSLPMPIGALEQTPTIINEPELMIISEPLVETIPLDPTLPACGPILTPAPETALSAPEITPEPVNEVPIETVPEAITTSTIPEVIAALTISPGELVINELVSDPLDSIEWVEIMNTTSQTLDLSGSSLVDAGNHKTLLPNQPLPGHAFLIIENPNGNLNNSSETITLINANGDALDTLTYGSAEIPAPQDGESLARNPSGQWLISIATRNQMNIFPTSVSLDTNPSTQAQTESEITPSTPSDTYVPLPTDIYETSPNTLNPLVCNPGTAPAAVAPTYNAQLTGTESVHRVVALAKSITTSKTDSKRQKSGSQITVTGTVIALPNTFGKQTMFLDGYEIYFHAADWPNLELGDVVSVTGIGTSTINLPKLKIASADDIVITGHIELTPAPISGSELATTRHGALVLIAGQVVGKNGNELSVRASDGTLITALGNKKTGVSWSQMQSGEIKLVGVVKNTDTGKVLAVRTLTDVQFTPDTETLLSADKPRTKTSPLVGGGLLTGTLGALGTWYVRSRTGLLS